jgi:uncharacterized caspase-like protein
MKAESPYVALLSRLVILFCLTAAPALDALAGDIVHGIGDPSMQTGDLYILSVGIDKYENWKYRLQLAGADARAFADELERRGGKLFPHVHKQVLLNGAATKGGIENAFDELAKAVGPQDTFIFLFAGNGSAFPKPGGGTDFYLFPSDMADNAELKGITPDLLRTYFSKIQSRFQLVVLDSCHSGASYEALASGVAERDVRIADVLGTNLIVLGTDTIEPEIEALGHGLITAALVDGFSGKADLNGDGIVSARELEAYLYSKGLELSNQYSRGDFHARTMSRGQDFKVAACERKAAPNVAAVAPSRGAPLVGVVPPKPAASRDGKDYALLIASDRYDHWNSLGNPVKDAEALKKVLSEKYGFEVETFYNKSRGEILDEIEKYTKRQYREQDQLFVFFAGHGVVSQYKQGFLVTKDSPAELTRDNENGFVSSNSLISMLNGNLSLKHLFLAFDACYAGAIWTPTVQPYEETATLNDLRPGGDSYAPRVALLCGASLLPASARVRAFPAAEDDSYLLKKMGAEARIVFTSGRVETVPDATVEKDGQLGEHSPFASALIKALEDGQGSHHVLTVGRIYSDYLEGIDPTPVKGRLPGSVGTFVFDLRPKGKQEEAR